VSSELWNWEKCRDAVKSLRGRLGFSDGSVIELLGLELDTDSGAITDKLTGGLVDIAQPQGRFTVNTVFFLLSSYSKAQSATPVSGLITSRQLKGARFTLRENVRERAAMAGRFGETPTLLVEAAKLLSGSRIEFPYGVAVRLHPLPLIPLTIVVSAGDEEFPSEASIFYSENIESYLDSEQAYFLTYLTVERLIRAAGRGPRRGPLS